MLRVIIISLLLVYSKATAYTDFLNEGNPLLQNLNVANGLDESIMSLDDYDQDYGDINLQISPEGAKELAENVFVENKRSSAPIGESQTTGLREKKDMRECTVLKVTREFEEQNFGYSVLPKKYSEYECVPVTTGASRLASLLPALQYHEVCLAKHCESVEKKMYYLRKDSEASCWSVASKIVKAGCACAAHKKYSMHSQH